jgi:putative two-component system response regulator
MAERILVVHGDGSMRHVIARAVLEAGHTCETAADEPEALLRLQVAPVALALLELDRPHLDGLRFLHRLRESYPDLALVPMTTLAQPSLVRESLRLGAADYVTLPVQSRQLAIRLETALERQRAGRQEQEYQRRLEAFASAQTEALQHTYREVLSVLGAALDTRDPETGNHSQRVIDWTLQVAREMGVRGAALRDVEWGAALHDVGKIGIPDRVLLKPGALTQDEWVIMKTHCEIGYRMLLGFDFLRGALPIVLHHHEWYDGSGYPTGLRAESIPFGARIFGVADAYDAMTSDRPYRRARSHEEAIDELRQGAGSQFDPEVVEAFMDTVGTTGFLQDARFASAAAS